MAALSGVSKNTTDHERRFCMGIVEILYSALFCFTMVFALLGCLYILIKLSTTIVRFIETKSKK